MEKQSSILNLLAGNKIFVPNYQRAYSWDTDLSSQDSSKQVNRFLLDLEDYNRSNVKSPYYFGHFIFEKKDENLYGVIDGQQRITTIIIFLSALFSRLKQIRPLKESELEVFEDIIKRNSTYRFTTVEYDNQLFKDYVIDQTKKDKNGIETQSARRIVDAFDFFTQYFSDKDEIHLIKMLNAVKGAICTTHEVENEPEAVQIFIFQNNRGKEPTNLEIIKAQFMLHIHLYGGEEKQALIDEIKNRFEKIYKAISFIEYNIDEDSVLNYTLKVYFNSLWNLNAIEKISECLSKENSIDFIKDFTRSLAMSFEYLMLFFNKDERYNFEVHSLISLGGIGIAIPFIIKAYQFGLPQSDLSQLCSALESLVLRHKLIGTKADITTRLNPVYEKFTKDNPSIKSIVDHINWMKNTDDWWWAYWNNQQFKNSLLGYIAPSTAKFLLWKYENYLESLGKSGYAPTRFDKIIEPQLEHIAPQTESPESGYDKYDEEFVNQYIECLGNYLLVSKSHNSSIGNKPFAVKRASYNHLAQQREIQEMTPNNSNWTRELIQKRKEKIIDFILNNF